MFKSPQAKAKQSKNLGRKETETLISLKFCIRTINFDIPDFNLQESSGGFKICCLISPQMASEASLHC